MPKTQLRTGIGASVTLDIADLSNCSDGTVQNVRELLGVATKHKTANKDISKSTAKVPSKSKLKGAATSSANKYAAPKNVQIHEPAEVLDNTDRKKLATEIVNISLQVLSKYSSRAKSHSTGEGTGQWQRCPSLHGDSAHVRDVSRVSLAERSPNQASNPRKKPPANGSLKVKSSDPKTDGVKAVASCCHVALSWLQTSGSSTNHGQIEQATAAFVRLLISLKYPELALKQVEALKSCIHTSLASGDRAKSQKIEPQLSELDRSSPTMSGRLARSLHFGTSTKDPKILTLMIGQQLLSLGIIGLKADLNLLGMVAPVLDPNHGSSPFQLIDRLCSLADDKETAARQMSSLASSISALRLTKYSSGQREGESQDQVSSTSTHFHLQTLVLRARLRAMQLAACKESLNEKIWQPFTRILLKYMSQSKESPSEMYKAVSYSFKGLESDNNNPSLTFTSSMAESEALDDISILLSQLAHTSGKLTEASMWIIERLNVLQSLPKMSHRSIKLSASLSTLIFLGADVNTEQNPKINVRQGCGVFDLAHGSKQDSSLVHTATKLHIAAAKCYKSLRFCLRKSSSRMDLHLLHDCGIVLSASSEWLLKIAEARDFVESVKSLEPSALKQLSASGKAHIEYITSLCAPLDEANLDLETWVRINLALTGSLSIVKLLDLGKGEITGDPATVESVTESCLIALSNASYRLYVIGLSKLPSLANQSLEISCQVLERATTESKKRGKFSVKLSKLARFQETKQDFAAAGSCWLRSVKIEVDAGGLQDLLSSYKTRRSNSPSLIEVSLGSLLTLIARHNLDTLGSQSFLDDAMLCLPERVLLLEIQLRIVSKWVGSKSLRASLKAVLPSLFSKLIEICEANELRTALLSVSHITLQLIVDAPDCVTSSIQQQTYEVVYTLLKADDVIDASNTWLQQHLKASIVAIMALLGKLRDSEQISRSLKTWERILDEQMDAVTTEMDSHDLESLLRLLSHLAYHCEVHGLHQSRLSALWILHRLKSTNLELAGTVLPCSGIDGALQLLRLGYLEQAKCQLDQIVAMTPSTSQFELHETAQHIAYAAYHLALNELDLCHERLEIAKVVLFRQKVSQGRNRIETVALHVCLKADYYDLESKYRIAIRDTVEALRHAKLELSLLQEFWKALNARDQGSEMKGRPGNDEEIGSNIDESLAKLHIGPHPTPKRSSDGQQPRLSAIRLPIITRLHRVYIDIAKLLYEIGDYDESMFHLKQGELLMRNVDAQFHVAETLARMGDYASRGGHKDESREHFESAGQVFKNVEPSKEVVDYETSLGHFYRLEEQWTPELQSYKRAEAVIDKLIAPRTTAESNTQRKMLSEHENELKPSKQRKQNMISRNTKEIASSTILSKSPGLQHPPSQFLASKLDLHCLMGESLLAQKNLAACRSILTELDKYRNTNALEVKTSLLRSRLLTQQALELMSEDAIFSMLPESTLSCPAISLTSPDPEASVCIPFPNGSHSRKAKPQKPSTMATKKPAPTLYSRVNQLLSNAFKDLDILKNVVNTVHTRAGDRLNVSFAAMLSMILAYTNEQEIKGIISSHLVALCIESQSISSGLTERQALIADQLLRIPNAAKSFTDNIPVISPRIETPGPVYNEFLKSLPDTWTVVSVSIDTDLSHLLLIKYKAGRSPFVVRLPLERQNEGAEDQSFTFQDAETELKEIINQSDSAVHAAREKPEMLVKPGAKSAWWAKREELNVRLGEFLFNIENVWFGGFRGLFSQAYHSTALVARFQNSLENILGKHLPSRQKVAKAKAVTGSKLDRHVLELFLDLGDPSECKFDGDEALTDLLYYIVDILQFNGEPNAYDEIDFDSLIVDVQSALQLYHDAARTKDPKPEKSHTILVLDKTLHAFPWESMPCLEGLSVSRVHSIVDVHERLMRLKRPTDSTVSEQCATVSSSGGTYILNPSGDLKMTQARFEIPLGNLSKESKWTGIIYETPKSDNILSSLVVDTSLRTNPSTIQSRVLLYLGHGSGFQYVKQRHVRALRCKQLFTEFDSVSGSDSSDCEKGPEAKPDLSALSEKRKPNQDNAPDTAQPISVSATSMNPFISVPLLFGCSSASLRVQGEFEPAGTSKTYMLAGAPAVLGSLWDVTDGDIDKFAGGVLERWGLLERGAFEREEARIVAESGKKKKKQVRKGGARIEDGSVSGDSNGSGQAEEADWGQMSLSDACARSRSNCYLKYLNGAAMVVYGVPVYLDHSTVD